MLGIIEGATCNTVGITAEIINTAVVTIDEILDKEGIENDQ
jgi:hypothetical protein